MALDGGMEFADSDPAICASSGHHGRSSTCSCPSTTAVLMVASVRPAGYRFAVTSCGKGGREFGGQLPPTAVGTDAPSARGACSASPGRLGPITRSAAFLAKLTAMEAVALECQLCDSHPSPPPSPFLLCSPAPLL
jgi:hypothetical protein